MKSAVLNLFPSSVSRWAKAMLRSYRLKRSARLSPCRIVIGASGISEPGWIPTEVEYLDLLKPRDWSRHFSPGSIDAIVAEHVWEHLTREEGILAAELCFQYLKKGGHLRAAVPDGLHPDPEYLQYVKPGGVGAGADDHKILYTYRAFREIFKLAGFSVDLLEYFDEGGEFHYKEWEPFDGMIHRSKRFDQRNAGGTLSYTSVILDARK